jgi:hypothetical protein
MLESEFECDREGPGALAAILESAARFGLSPDEIWEAVIETPDRLPEDLRAPYVEELTRALAKRLLQQERSF